MQAIESAVKDEGWKMVMLLRLSPILPFALLNYGLSVTPISAWTYTWASAAGIIPGLTLNHLRDIITTAPIAFRMM